jgi:hypothetical protein
MLAAWKNAEKSASFWPECAAQCRAVQCVQCSAAPWEEKQTDRGFVHLQDMGLQNVFKADLP